MEITDVTQIASPRRRVRRWLAGVSAPPSLKAQLVLMFSALLLGGVMSSLLFVGIWRHTAADGQRARAAQVADRQQLQATQRKLASLEAAQARAQAALTKARHRQAAAAAQVLQLRQLHHAVGNSLQPRLQALAGTGATLAHDTATLKSEIAALRAYLTTAAPAGADSAFLDAQIKYLVASTEHASAAASSLEQQTQAAQAAAAKLGKPTH